MNNLEGSLIRELKSLVFAKAALEDLSSGNYTECADALTNLIKVLCYQPAPSSGDPK